MTITVRNNAPRIQGFNGMKIVFLPRGSVRKDNEGNETEVDTRDLTADEAVFLKTNESFKALVASKDMVLVGIKPEDFFGEKLAKPGRTAADKALAEAGVNTSATEVTQANLGALPRVDLTEEKTPVFDPSKLGA